MTAAIVDRAPRARFEDSPAYLVEPAAKPAARKSVDEDDAIIARALAILGRRLRKVGGCGQPAIAFSSPAAVRQYLQLQLAHLDHEEFGVAFLDAQNRLIEFRAMFRGTLTQTSVYPREVVKEALELGAASVILSHNHPSGTVQPSRADEALTQTLKSALALVDVRVLDHVIVAAGDSLSMAERGLV